MNGIILVVGRACGTCQIIDLIRLIKIWIHNIMLHKCKVVIIQKLTDVVHGACKKAVHTHHLIFVFHQSFAEMGADKAGASGNNYSAHFLSPLTPI